MQVGEMNGDRVVNMHERICSFFYFMFEGSDSFFVRASFDDLLL